MPAALFVLNWSDYSTEQPAPSALSPALLGHALHRHLALSYGGYAAYVCETRSPARAGELAHLLRWGLRPLDDTPGPSLLGRLASEHPEARDVILAMRAEHAASALDSLRSLGKTVQIWHPDGDGWRIAAPESACVVRRLSEALHLHTARAVALLVDWGYFCRALARRGESLEPADIRGPLLRTAGLVGSVVSACLYGPWEGCSPLELAGSEAPPMSGLRAGEDPHRGEVEMLEAIERILEDPQPPDTLILVSESGWLPDVMRRAHARGIRVLLWPMDAAALSPAALAEADGYASLGGLLLPDHAAEPQGVAAAQGTAPAAGAEALTGTLEAPDSTIGALRETEFPLEMIGLNPSPPAGGRLGPWVRLLYHTECLLRQHQSSRISFRKLAVALAELEEFGPTPANAMMWLNRAKAEGMVLIEQEPHRTDTAIRVTTCRPNPDHAVTRAAVEVPDRCLRLLCQMLQKMPWVSFKLLRSVLLREQWLGGAPYELEETSIDEWLNFLVHDGAITLTKEPNLANPDYPVTALRLSVGHPLARAVLVEAAEGTRLGAERAILAVDHFLTRNRKPWMAMSALRRALEGLGREELQEVLQCLQNLGALVTESYPNPQKEHSTTGCRLKPDEPIVRDALVTRNAIIRVTQYHQRYRSWVPLAKVEEDLTSQHGPPPSNSHRMAWFLLLRDEGILELEPDGLLTNGGAGDVRCRLNVTDAVVRAVVADHPEASPDPRLP